MYDVLKENHKVSFDFIDISIPYSQQFGIIDFDNN